MPRSSQSSSGFSLVRAAVVGALGIVGISLVGCAEPEVIEEDEGSTESQLARTAESCETSSDAELASIARSRAGTASQHECYRFVKGDLAAAGISTSALGEYGAAAYQFAEWANRNPSALAKMGFRRAAVGYASAPQGSIVVWPKTKSGARSDFGHIEIAVGGGIGCSDVCGKMAPVPGEAAPAVFVPITCASP